MNFKPYFTKAVARCTVIRDANEDEIADVNFYYNSKGGEGFLIKPIDKGWRINCREEEYMIFPNYCTHMQPYIEDQSYIMFDNKGNFINYSTDRVPTNILQNSELKRAITAWDVKKTLNQDTVSALGDLIDEL
jgi:hypothetical protein